MATLKAGRVADFSNSMAEAMEKALAEEWQVINGQPLPEQGQADRRLLLVAIARGVLEYLKAHEDEILTRITLVNGGIPRTETVADLEVNL